MFISNSREVVDEPWNPFTTRIYASWLAEFSQRSSTGLEKMRMCSWFWSFVARCILYTRKRAIFGKENRSKGNTDKNRKGRERIEVTHRVPVWPLERRPLLSSSSSSSSSLEVANEWGTEEGALLPESGPGPILEPEAPLQPAENVDRPPPPWPSSFSARSTWRNFFPTLNDRSLLSNRTFCVIKIHWSVSIRFYWQN